MSANEIWQEVQCPQGDHDRFGDDLLILGQRFHCHLCGSEHAANPESVTTMMEIDGVMSYPDLPETAEQLEAIKAAAGHALRVGDYVTRDGSDVHRLISIDPCFADSGDFECVHPSDEGWCIVGEVESNLLERYRAVGLERLRALGLA